MGDVAFIKPKTMRRVYKRHHFTVTFIPATKKWKWEVEIVTTNKFSETADTMVKAIRAAEKCIDKVEKIRTGE